MLQKWLPSANCLFVYQIPIQYAPGLKVQEQPEGSLEKAQERSHGRGKIRADKELPQRSRLKARLKAAIAVVTDCNFENSFLVLETDLGGNQ